MAGIGAKIIDALTGGIGSKIVDTIDKFVPDKDLARTLKHQLNMTELTGDLDLRKIEIEAERDVEVAIQQTHQAELNQSDLRTKRTRPKIAQQSWYVSMAYGVSYLAAKMIPLIPAFDFQWQVYIAMASPALTYMGVRTFDKWKNGAA